MTRARHFARAGALIVAMATAAFVAPGAVSAAPSPSDAATVAGSPNGVSGKRAAEDSWKESRPIRRQAVDADGTTQNYPFADPFDVTVRADHTRNLRGRERVEISWSGAQPSGGRSGNPYGLSGMTQEYPVVILQCRGTGRAVTPETCWTSSYGERSQVSRSDNEATWTRDLDAAPADKEKVSGLSPFPSAAECPNVDRTGLYYTHVTPFVTAKGKVYSACDKDHMPPEAAADSAFPPAEIAAFTDDNGQGSVQFEVRTDVENESLGCNHEVDCSIVVIPIVGVSCDRASTAVENELALVEKSCRKTGQWAPGSSNFAGLSVDQAVSPALWWSASNWKNRFVIPITFGLPPDTCDILDPRPPTGFFGSELLAQAALQWAPAYCLEKKRFKFQFNSMPDETGWNLMTTGGGPAAVVSSAHEPGADPVGYAPTGVTGFSIGYVIDRPGNQGEYTRLRLNARLVAKLLTQSYVGSGLGKDHPGMSANPWAIMADPEFIKLNPGLSQTTQEAGAALLSLSNSSDVMEQLTDWIAHDQDAMDFIDGKPDPWGMRVNPSYKNLDLPRNEWPLLDTYVPETGSECLQNNPSNYFSLLAAPVTTMQKIAVALLDSWPNVQTRCETDASTTPHTYKLGRVDRQTYGSRFMLGVVSLGDAARFGLRSAALEAKTGSYVAPTNASLAAALKLTTQRKRYGPFALDQGDVRKSGQVYPGAMVVYTAARLRNLDQADADKVAQFIRVSTTEGQRSGSGNGDLPDGFLPIKRTGVTARLFDSAQDVAAAVEAQKEPQAHADPTDEPGSDGGSGADGGTTTPPGVPGDSTPSAAANPSAAPSAPPAAATPMPATQAVGSNLAGGLLPILILLGLVACVVATILRIAVPSLRARR
jgi:hypothetical protein